MKQTLEQFGWYMYHSCRCGGTLKQKFKHPSQPGVEVHVQPNRNTWQKLLNKRVVASGVSNTLEANL